MNSNQATRRLVPSRFFFFFFYFRNTKTAPFRIKIRDFLLIFNLALQPCISFNLTLGIWQLDPYSLAPCANWPLSLDFVNLTPN